MMADANDANPYCSPLASCDPLELTNASAPRVIRWRVIPVTVLYLFGAFLVFGGLTVFGVSFWRIAQGSTPLPQWGESICVVPGAFFLYAGWSIWNGPRRRAALAILLAVISYLGCAAVASHFGW